MDPLEAFTDHIRTIFEANLSETATEIAQNLRENVERLPITCRHTPFMRQMKLVDGQNYLTADGIRAYNSLKNYYAHLDEEERKEKESEARERRTQVSPGYVSITGKEIPPLPYDSRQLESD